MGEFRITGPGRYRCRNGQEVTIAFRDNDLVDYPWRQDSNLGNGCAEDGTWDQTECPHPQDIIASIDEPQTEMAGLTGFVQVVGKHCRPVTPSLCHTNPFDYAIDLSKVPASAIVNPEPKRETVMCRFWAFESGVIICRRKDENSWPGHGDKPISHWEQEITFTHGEGLGDAS